MTLAQVRSRRRAVVVGHASDPQSRRLAELGLRPGAVVEVVRRAPFGGPLAVRVSGTLLAMRPVDAALVLVTEEPAA